MTDDNAAHHEPFCSALAGFRAGTDSPRDYLERCIARIEAREPAVKAFVHLDLEGARRSADAASQRYRQGSALSDIDGMPIGVKDIVETADMPTQMNSPLYEGYMARGDAASVRATRQGGGVLVGKTVTTEYAIGGAGPTVNPHDEAHTPGGSSSGSAAGVAAGMFAAAYGTQTQGSIVRPASYCGVVGYKPTLGALSLDGVHPLSRTHDHLGTLAGSVDDAWALARWISEHAVASGGAGLSGPLKGPVRPSAPARLGVLRTNGLAELDADSAAAFEGVLEKLGRTGVEIVESDDDPALGAIASGFDDIGERSLDMVAYEMRWPFADYVARHGDMMGERIHKLMARAKAMSRDDYRAHLAFRAGLGARVAAITDEVDAFILPAASGPAPRGLDFTGSRTLLIYASFLSLPVYSIPAAKVGQLPLGIQLISTRGTDHRLTRHAAWVADQLGDWRTP